MSKNQYWGLQYKKHKCIPDTEERATKIEVLFQSIIYYRASWPEIWKVFLDLTS